MAKNQIICGESISALPLHRWCVKSPQNYTWTLRQAIISCMISVRRIFIVRSNILVSEPQPI